MNLCSLENFCNKDEKILFLNVVKFGVCVKCKEEFIFDFELCCICLYINLVFKFKIVVNKNLFVILVDYVFVVFLGGLVFRFEFIFFRVFIEMFWLLMLYVNFYCIDWCFYFGCKLDEFCVFFSFFLIVSFGNVDVCFWCVFVELFLSFYVKLG